MWWWPPNILILELTWFVTYSLKNTDLEQTDTGTNVQRKDTMLGWDLPLGTVGAQERGWFILLEAIWRVETISRGGDSWKTSGHFLCDTEEKEGCFVLKDNRGSEMEKYGMTCNPRNSKWWDWWDNGGGGFSPLHPFSFNMYDFWKWGCPPLASPRHPWCHTPAESSTPFTELAACEWTSQLSDPAYQKPFFLTA